MTQGFKELVQTRITRDHARGDALLRKGIDTMLSGDVDTGKAILRDYIKATMGFEKLGEATGIPPKSLIRMLGPRGNPQARNLFGVIGYLQKQAAVKLQTKPIIGAQMNRQPATATDSCFDVPRLVQCFESLGENCDFGVVQRAVGVEPFGLFRFAGCNAADMEVLMQTRFEQLGTPEDLFLEETGPDREVWVRSRRFSFAAHTESVFGKDEPEAVRAAQIRKVRFLKGQLLRDLKEAHKLFVFKGQAAPDTVSRIAAKLRAYGPNSLLWVDLADARQPPGTVERMSDGLMRGFVRHFGTYDDDPCLPVEDWVSVCGNAYRLWRGEDPPRMPFDNLIAQTKGEQRCEWISHPAAATDKVTEPGPNGDIAFEHRLRATARVPAYYAYLPIPSGGSFVFSVWIRIPEDFGGRRIFAVFHGFPIRASWDGHVKSRGYWQRLWVTATLPQDARDIACGIIAEAAVGDVFYSTAWCLERGTRPSGYGFAL